MDQEAGWWLSCRQRSTVKALWEMHHPKACQPYLNPFLCGRYFVVCHVCCFPHPQFFFLLVRGWGKVGLEGVCMYVCVCVCVYVQSVLWCFMPIAPCQWDPTALPVSRVSRDGSDEDGSVGVGAQR